MHYRVHGDRLLYFWKLLTQPQLGPSYFFVVYLFGGLQCVGHSFAYVAYFVFMIDVRKRIQGFDDQILSENTAEFFSKFAI